MDAIIITETISRARRLIREIRLRLIISTKMDATIMAPIIIAIFIFAQEVSAAVEFIAVVILAANLFIAANMADTPFC